MYETRLYSRIFPILQGRRLKTFHFKQNFVLENFVRCHFSADKTAPFVRTQIRRSSPNDSDHVWLVSQPRNEIRTFHFGIYSHVNRHVTGRGPDAVRSPRIPTGVKESGPQGNRERTATKAAAGPSVGIPCVR